ncbi:glutathione-dependent formaldehyde dehydrogenase [Candidatus Obscuribacterales bacterium]|nr:glutathione-dependent formaldehyde dehydrogenase [Candidatus Obscuribacterales bacterium]
MKAVVFKGVGDVKLESVPEPIIEKPADAIIRITATSICGTDLHMVRGTMPGMKSGTVLGHEAVGVVEEVGSAVRDIKKGDRVVVCSTIACGDCVYCKSGEFASCERANPNGSDAGTAFFGGPAMTGSFNGLQAEFARIPFADTTLVKLPDAVSDEDALLCSDIFPTGYMAAEICDVKKGDMIAVFGCGPVGQMAIASAFLMGASKVFAIDVIPDRLEMASRQGAVIINYDHDDPTKILKQLTNGYGPDGVIDAVGVDAQHPSSGPAAGKGVLSAVSNIVDQKMVAPWTVLFGDQWKQGNAPSQVLQWCVESVRYSGVVSIVGVYPQTAKFFPIGLAMNKSLTVRGANCSHRKYIPKLLELVEKGDFHPSTILTVADGLTDAISCYKNFDKRRSGWVKVELIPAQSENIC